MRLAMSALALSGHFGRAIGAKAKFTLASGLRSNCASGYIVNASAVQGRGSFEEIEP
jgi:hypothetical protein